MSAYRLTKPLQPGDKIRVLPNRWGFAKEGDIGTLVRQHHTMIGRKMVPAGWSVQVQWRWTEMRLLSLILDLLVFNWGHINRTHLFESDFEVIG